MTEPFGFALAPSQPDKSESFIIQFAPGSTTVPVGRGFGELLAIEPGTTVLAVSRVGAGGTD